MDLGIARQMGPERVTPGEEDVRQRAERTLDVEVPLRVQRDAQRFVDAEYREGVVVGTEIVVVVEVGAGAPRGASGERHHQAHTAPGREAHFLRVHRALVEPDADGDGERVAGIVPQREQELEAVPRRPAPAAGRIG